MNRSLMQHYIKLTEFLGRVLGPDYEIVLHDLSNKTQSVVAIANSHISDRTVGAPLTNVALKALMDRSYEKSDFLLNYRGMSGTGHALRSSTLFIKQDEELVGLLCVNFDDSKFHAISEDILKLCHPDTFVETNFEFDQSRILEVDPGSGAEQFRSSPEAIADDAVNRIRQSVAEDEFPPGLDKRLAIIKQLEGDGIFQIKGTVKRIARSLGVSQATIYRYLKMIHSEGKP